jgi:hypothetical protein
MASMPPPGVPNPFDDDASRWQRAQSNVDHSSRKWAIVFVGGFVVLAVWALAVAFGQGDVGLIMAPVGLGMIVGGGVQLFIDRISRL